MVDAVNIKTPFAGTHIHIINLSNQSDGTGESAVTKLDISTLTGPDGNAPSSVSLMEASWNVQGMGYVLLEWDATTNDEMLVCSGNGFISFEGVGGLHDPKSTGTTGDVILTTDPIAGTDGDSYDITLVFKLKV